MKKKKVEEKKSLPTVKILESFNFYSPGLQILPTCQFNYRNAYFAKASDKPVVTEKGEWL